MTKEERQAAYANYRIEIIEDRIYAVVTLDYGRKPHEVHVQDMYQRLHAATDTVRKYWHGTMLAADHKHAEREARMKQLREFHEARRG
jgi:hypothetical protein